MTRPIVLLVPQAFKETLAAGEVAAAMAEGCRAAGAHPEVVPGSDGGDGLIEALRPHVTRTTTISVTGPLGTPVTVPIVWIEEGVAVIESRLICGLGLVAAHRRDPFTVTSRGVGDAIRRVVDAGGSQVVIGLGGSAMVDGGWGMATALGWEFRARTGEIVVPGRDRMGEIHCARGTIDPGCGLTALCDVDVPFTGPGGAVLFATQKGAGPGDLAELASDIDRFVSLQKPWSDLAEQPGAGAAGGLGFGLAAFAGARLTPGADWVLERTRFADLLDRVVLVVTAEGRFDATSLRGKLTGTVVRRAAAAGLPAMVLAPATDGAGSGLEGLTVVSGGGRWTARDVAARTQAAVRDALGLLGH